MNTQPISPGMNPQPMQPYPGQQMQNYPGQPMPPMAPAPMANPSFSGQPMMMGVPPPNMYSDAPQLQDPNFPPILVPPFIQESQAVTCIHCKGKVMTGVSKGLNGAGCILMCLLFYIFCPLSWLPLLYDYSYSYIHSCPHCKGLLTTAMVPQTQRGTVYRDGLN